MLFKPNSTLPLLVRHTRTLAPLNCEDAAATHCTLIFAEMEHEGGKGEVKPHHNRYADEGPKPGGTHG